MAGMTHAPRTHPREPLILGIVLVAVGVGAFLLNVYPEAGSWVVLLIGLGLLAVFAYPREYGYLVPGGIMTGLGAGILASNALVTTGEEQGGVIVLGLGLGFLAIWVISGLLHLKEHHAWPLVPGGILATVGAALMIGGQAIDLLRYWPAILIVIGFAAIWRAFMARDGS